MPVKAIPFPGMDPNLESRWSDVRAKLNVFIGESLQPSLLPGLSARTEERILVTERDPTDYSFRSDVAVVTAPTSPPETIGAAAGIRNGVGSHSPLNDLRPAHGSRGGLGHTRTLRDGRVCRVETWRGGGSRSVSTSR
jgi:hypothetical protein